MERKGPTQLERLLKALQDHPEGLTSLQIIGMYILNYKGRTSDLRHGKLNKTCYDIETVHVKGGIWKYVLHSERKIYAEQNGQLAFI